MSKTNKITSMAELHERQEELKREREAAKAGLANSLKRTPATVSRYAYEDLALPVMGLGLAAYIGYRLLRSKPAPAAVETPEAPPEPAASVPAPSVPPARAYQPAAPVRQPDNDQTTAAAGSSFDFKSLISAGKILIPAAQAIIGVIQSHQSKEQTWEQVEAAKEELAEVKA